MKFRLHLAVLALALVPGSAFAACFDGHVSAETTMSCAEGTVYDADSQSCVPVVSG